MSAFMKPPIPEQMKDLATAEEEYPELRGILGLRRVALLAQYDVEMGLKEGGKLDLSNPCTVTRLEQAAHRSREPIAHFLSASIFEKDYLLRLCDKMVRGLIRQGADIGLLGLLDELKTSKADEVRWLDGALKGNTDDLEAEGKRTGVDPSLLFFAASMLIQPLLEEIARKVTPPFLEAWEAFSCPVCGRDPSIARRRAGKRYLICTFCGAEHPTEPFSCVHCGNKDPYTLKFIVHENEPGLQVDFCEKCRRYLKVVVEGKARRRLPRGLEDLLTYELDRLAEEAGLSKKP